MSGDSSRPALLLMHGFPSSSRMFRGVLDQLSEVSYVIAPDLPGFGESDPIEAPTFARFAEITERLLERLGIAHCDLYLHDFGAAVGLHLATSPPVGPTGSAA